MLQAKNRYVQCIKYMLEAAHTSNSAIIIKTDEKPVRYPIMRVKAPTFNEVDMVIHGQLHS